MRCARCKRDLPEVQLRPRFCPGYLCDLCNEYSETWETYKWESGNKDHTEFYRLYDRLGELRDKIDGFLREQRMESEKNACPGVKKSPERGAEDRF
jgi:hypothetical protein